MLVILLDNIHGLGNIGEEVAVRRGYARNWLLPKKKALLANADNREYFATRREQLEQAALQRLSVAEQRAEAIRKLEILTVAANIDENDQLYGSVGPKEIVNALHDLDIEVDKREVLLPNALKTVGEHNVQIQFHSDLTVTLPVAIVPATQK